MHLMIFVEAPGDVTFEAANLGDKFGMLEAAKPRASKEKESAGKPPVESKYGQVGFIF